VPTPNFQLPTPNARNLHGVSSILGVGIRELGVVSWVFHQSVI
jgi:hypothetical protein